MTSPSQTKPTRERLRPSPTPFVAAIGPAPTIEQLSVWLDAERTCVEQSRPSGLTNQYAALQEEFGRLTEQTARLLADHRLEHREAAVLRQSLDLVLAVLQLIESELTRLSTAAGRVASPRVIAELIGLCRELLDGVQAQLRLLETLEVYAGDLRQIVSKLLFQKHVGPARLQNLARRILLDVRESSTDLLLPQPGLVVRNFLRRAMVTGRAERKHGPRVGCPLLPTSRSEPTVYPSGIQTARLLGFAADWLFGWADRLELVTIAALLQDVGLLLLETRYDLSPRQLEAEEPAAYRRHPVIGAAVAGALTGYAVDLPSLIAQHHERCDGIGYPRGLRAENLSAPARLLAIANRFVELTQPGEDEELPGISDNHPYQLHKAAHAEQSTADLYQAAARKLWREAEQEEFDRLLTERFLEALGFDESGSRHASASPTLYRHFTLDRMRAKQFRRDAAQSSPAGRSVSLDAARESSVPAPKFLRRAAQRSSAASSAPFGAELKP